MSHVRQITLIRYWESGTQGKTVNPVYNFSILGNHINMLSFRCHSAVCICQLRPYMPLWIRVEQFWISVQILSLTSVTLCCNQSSFSPTNVMHFHTYILTRRDKKESKDFQSRQTTIWNLAVWRKDVFKTCMGR